MTRGRGAPLWAAGRVTDRNRFPNSPSTPTYRLYRKIGVCKTFYKNTGMFTPLPRQLVEQRSPCSFRARPNRVERFRGCVATTHRAPPERTRLYCYIRGFRLVLMLFLILSECPASWSASPFLDMLQVARPLRLKHLLRRASFHNSLAVLLRREFSHPALHLSLIHI